MDFSGTPGQRIALSVLVPRVNLNEVSQDVQEGVLKAVLELHFQRANLNVASESGATMSETRYRNGRAT